MSFYRRMLWIGLVIGLLAGLNTASAAPLLQQGSRITYNETVRGTITDSETEQHWVFTGHTGDLILIDMRADSTGMLDDSLTLLDANGNTLTSDDDSGDSVNARIGPYALPADGDYTIVAAQYSGTGGYALELKDLRTVPAMVTGKSLVGVVNAGHTTDYFLLTADSVAAGTIWKLDINSDDPISEPYASLYGSDGFITSTESSSDPASLDPIVPVAGENYVIAVSWNPNGTGGPYEIKLAPSNLQILQDGVAQDGTLDYDNYSRVHYFQGEKGASIRVTVSVDGDISPGMSISSVDYTYSLYSGEGESAKQVTVLITLPATTLYTVEVYDSSYAGNSGSYKVEVDWVKE